MAKSVIIVDASEPVVATEELTRDRFITTGLTECKSYVDQGV